MKELLESLLKKSIEAVEKMSPKERALMLMHQKRSYVVSELMWGSDKDEELGRDAMTREEAEALYDATPEGVALKLYEGID